MIPPISQANLLRLMDCFEVYKAGGYTHMRDTCSKVEQLSEEEMWLLAFVQYMVMWNRIWPTLDETPYYLVPTVAVQRSSFEDFINLLRLYTKRKLSPKNEKPLIVFLRGCTEKFKEFYLDILSRQEWLRGFFTMRNIYQYIDRSLVHPEDIYGELTWYKARFAKLPFPIMVTAVSGKLPNGMLVVTSTGPKVYVFRDNSKVKLPNGWLALDRRFLTGHPFTMLGLVDEEGRRFYPTDYFDGDDYRKFLKGGAVIPYYSRLRVLDHYLSHNRLRQIVNHPKVYLAAAAEVDDAVRKVLVGSSTNHLLFTKENQKRVIFETLEVKGVIGGVWTEQGVAKGLQVWHNAQLLNCSYHFGGGDNALLFDMGFVVGKVVKFWLFRHDDHKAGCVREILWDEKPFGTLALEGGSRAHLEKCAYCAKDGSEVRIKYRGLCYNTVCNLQSLFGRHGADTWITPPPLLQARREATGWEPSLLNLVGFTYKGHRIVCREDGSLMFQSDPETMEAYLSYINRDTKWANWVREHRLQFVSAADLRERYLARYTVGGGKRG